jgi:Ca2+-transporting ATPase
MTIVSAIREGRRIYDNIRKFILFLLRANFDELLFIMMTLLLQMPLPYLPLHILWINLMTDSFPALALGMERAEPDIMRRPPRPPSEHVLSGEDGRLTIAALLAFGVAFLYFLWQLSRGVPLAEARTATFTLAIVFELFLVWTLRSRRPVWQIEFFSNPWLIGGVCLPFGMQILLLYTPLRTAFHLVPLTLEQWVMILILASSGFVLFELLKLPWIQSKSR